MKCIGFAAVQMIPCCVAQIDSRLRHRNESPIHNLLIMISEITRSKSKKQREKDDDAQMSSFAKLLSNVPHGQVLLYDASAHRDVSFKFDL